MPRSNRTVLGIDPGISRLGYGIVVDRRARPVLAACGVIETGSKQPIGVRLRRLHDGLQDLIRLHRPDRVAIEQLFVSRNVRTAVAVGQARGVAILAAAMHRLPIVECSPQAVKLAVTGYGRAEKQQVQRMVQAIFRLRRPPQPDDAADAVAVALCGFQQPPQ